MAIIHPEGWRELAVAGPARREVETLERLATGLSDDYTVYHGIHWTRVTGEKALFGSVDFVLVEPGGGLLLLEQRPGLLEETPEGLVKRHERQARRISVDLARVREAVRERLSRALGGAPPGLDILFYCPDYRLRTPGSAGIDPARVVDAGRREQLAERIRSILPAQAASPLADKVHRFLRDELQLAPDAGALIGQSRRLYTRLSGGLAHWARRIDCHPFRLRVTGTAGSGKTQLALALLDDAVRAGRHPLYVCYNRPLADHVAAIAPSGAEVATYHQLADRRMRAAGQAPDFSQPGAFQRLEAYLAEQPPAAAYDELIVDEGQDFQPPWRDALLRLLAPAGRAWWLEDPLQNIYARPPLDWHGWVGLDATTNYRSPREVLAWLNPLLGEAAMTAGSPITGGEVELLVYDGPDELLERSKTAITRALGAGFKKDAIALLTYRGREHSAFTPLAQLGPHRLRAFTGRYDLLGSPIHSDGDLLIDSVYRFKGQSAPCVILTEIDFDHLDSAALRKLFVGATRATLKLILVASARVAPRLAPK